MVVVVVVRGVEVTSKFIIKCKFSTMDVYIVRLREKECVREEEREKNKEYKKPRVFLCVIAFHSIGR